jgi:uncharacterized protein (UPF0264 family)
MIQLLVSVRSVEEADEALSGGADLIDMKDPAQGPLGRVGRPVARDIVSRVGGRKPVSLAGGELSEVWTDDFGDLTGIRYLKIGLAGWAGRDWVSALRPLVRQVASKGSQLVVVAYADCHQAQAPAPEDVLEFAREHRLAAWMIDTWTKDGRHLFDWQTPATIRRLGQRCRQADLAWALAGSLRGTDAPLLRELRPTWVAVRGSVCLGGRTGRVQRDLISRWKDLLCDEVRVAESATGISRSEKACNTL